MKEKPQAPKAPAPIPDRNQVEQPESLPRRWWRESLGNGRRVATVAATVFAVFLGWHVVTGRNGLNSWQRKSLEEKALAQEIQKLSAENAHLSQHVERLKSDPAAIEDEARKRLHYARPNEIIYALPASPPNKSATPPPARPTL